MYYKNKNDEIKYKFNNETFKISTFYKSSAGIKSLYKHYINTKLYIDTIDNLYILRGEREFHCLFDQRKPI